MISCSLCLVTQLLILPASQISEIYPEPDQPKTSSTASNNFRRRLQADAGEDAGAGDGEGVCREEGVPASAGRGGEVYSGAERVLFPHFAYPKARLGPPQRSSCVNHLVGSWIVQCPHLRG